MALDTLPDVEWLDFVPLPGDALRKAPLGNGTKTYQYNSGNVSSAMAKQAKLVPYTNAWVDNWPTY